MTALFWGGTFIAGKLLAQSVDPSSAAFLRFSIASVFLLYMTFKIEGCLPKLKFKQLPIVIALGFTGIFSYNLFFFSGLNHIQANQASLIIACNPIFISIFAIFIFKEDFNLIKGLGLILSVLGALIVISKGNLFNIVKLGVGKGEMLIFGCVISWVAYSILGKKAMNDFSPITSVTYSSIAGTLMLLFPAISNGMADHITSYSLIDWSSLFYLGFFGTALGFLWYYEGINQIGPLKAGMFINFVPISAIISAFFILKEPLTTSLSIGALFVITGVYLTNSFKTKPKES